MSVKSNDISMFSCGSFCAAILTALFSIMLILEYLASPDRIDYFFMAEFGFIASLIIGGVSVLHMKLEDIEAKQ